MLRTKTYQKAVCKLHTSRPSALDEKIILASLAQRNSQQLFIIYYLFCILLLLLFLFFYLFIFFLLRIY